MSDSEQPINASGATVVQTGTVKPTKQKWSLKKKIAVIATALVTVFVAVFVIANVATDAPLKVSNEFVTNIQSGNASTAYDLMSADAQNATNSKDFAAVVDQLGPILTGKPDVTSKEVSAQTGSDPSAKVVYKIAGSDDINHIITVNLVQKDGKWEVLNFESVKENAVQL